MTENTAAITEALADTGTVETVEVFNEDAELGKAFDRLVTNNGADRAEDGKFTSSSPKAEDAVTASPGGEEGAGGDDAAPAVGASPAPANDAPGVLPESVRSSWASIPEAARKDLAAWATEQRAKFGAQGQQLASVKPIADRINEAVTRFPQFKGMTPERIAQGAVQLAAVQVEMERNPLDTLLKVAEQYNVLPQLQAKLTGQQLPEGTAQISTLQREIVALKQQLASVADPSQIETHVSRVFEGRAAQEAVNQFATDPANSFFPVVEPHLPGLIAEVKEAKPGLSAGAMLKEAYDLAFERFPSLKAAKEAAAQSAAAPLAAERTAAAKKAASINVKSTSTGKERPLSEDEEYAAAYARATSR